jgi:hypothetical protein
MKVNIFIFLCLVILAIPILNYSQELIDLRDSIEEKDFTNILEHSLLRFSNGTVRFCIPVIHKGKKVLYHGLGEYEFTKNDSIMVIKEIFANDIYGFPTRSEVIELDDSSLSRNEFKIKIIDNDQQPLKGLSIYPFNFKVSYDPVIEESNWEEDILGGTLSSDLLINVTPENRLFDREIRISMPSFTYIQRSPLKTFSISSKWHYDPVSINITNKIKGNYLVKMHNALSISAGKEAKIKLKIIDFKNEKIILEVEVLHGGIKTILKEL